MKQNILIIDNFAEGHIPGSKGFLFVAGDPSICLWPKGTKLNKLQISATDGTDGHTNHDLLDHLLPNKLSSVSLLCMFYSCYLH